MKIIDLCYNALWYANSAVLWLNGKSYKVGDHGRWKCLKVGGASSGRGHGERMRAYNGGLGAEPLAGSRAEPLVEG